MHIQEAYYQWQSQATGTHMDMLVFGHSGQPLILFPTSKGSYYQNKDEGMIDAARWFIEQGRLKIYCPASLDDLSWYNRSVPAGVRAWNHNCYDQLLLTEILPRAQQETGFSRTAVAGCSFGGYHAVNFAFRHPSVTSYCFSMSGAFDIRSFVGTYYDDNVYYNNPVDFIPNDQDPNLWNMGVVLGTTDQDQCRPDNERLSAILTHKQIHHWLDIRPNAVHDWPVWRAMFPDYLSLMR